jgi:AcrR family transcriptional regulator
MDIGALSQRQRILGSVAENCAEKTFAATTIGDIVKGAGISRGTFYKHFENKRACFGAAVEAFLAELREAIVDAYSSADSKTEAVRDAIAVLLDRMAAKPEYAHLLLVEAPAVDPAIVQSYRRIAIDALQEDWQPREGTKAGGADPKIAFGRAKVLIAYRLASREIDQIPKLLPELVYIALLPYVGQTRALKQAELNR